MADKFANIFRRAREQPLDPPEFISAFFFIMCFGLLVLGFLGHFSRPGILILLAAMVVFAIFFRPRVSLTWKIVLLVSATAASGLGFMLLRGFFIGDVYYHWLPFARAIAQSGGFPEFVNFNWFSAMPLQSLLFSGTFVLFGSTNEFLNLWVPFFFSGATVLLLVLWAKEEGGGSWVWYVAVFFLMNQGAQWYGTWNLMQEPLVLFFSTLFFFFLDRNQRMRDDRSLLFALFSLSLAALSKINGVFLLILLPVILLKARRKGEVLMWATVAMVPVGAWLLRNYLVYENPVFPLLNSLFGGRYAHALAQNSDYFHHQFSPFPTLWSRVSFTAQEVLDTLPFLPLTFYGLWRIRRWRYVFAIALFAATKELLAFSSASGVRYYYPLFGLFIVYAVIGLRHVRSKVFLATLAGLASFQLFSTPPIDSGSAIIAHVEKVFPVFRAIAGFVYIWRLPFSVLVAVSVLFTRDIEDLKHALASLYAIFLLKLKFVANKTWLATWPFLLSGVALIFPWPKIATRRRAFSISLLTIILLVSSWGLAAGYFAGHGIEFPVGHVWESSRWAEKVILSDTGYATQDFFVLIFAQRDYFMWYSSLRAVTYSDFDFHLLTEKYDKRLSAHEVQALFSEKKIKYIVKNSLSHDVDNRDFEAFERSIRSSELFQKVAESSGGYTVWKVY